MAKLKAAAALPNPPVALRHPVFSQALACRAPQTKEELAYYLLHVLRLRCDVCQGVGTALGPDGRSGTCPRCGGAGGYGLHMAPRAVCPGCTAPLDIAWGLWTGQPAAQLIVGGRKCGKTSLLAAIAHLKARHKRRHVVHMGAIYEQAERCERYVEAMVSGSDKLAFDAVTLDPVPPWAPRTLPEVKARHGKPGGGKEIAYGNGGVIELLPGTEAQASGPHPHDSVLDELDEVRDWRIVQQFIKTPRETMTLASTRHRPGGMVVRAEKELSGFHRVQFCLWESLQRCTYPCDAVPLPDGRTGPCPLYDEEVTEGGVRRRRPLCGGTLARQSDGWLPVAEAIRDRLRDDPRSWGVQYVLRPPVEGVGGRAYWHYGPWNRLEGNPLDDPARPLWLCMDFNRNPMAWGVIQEAPDSTEDAPRYTLLDLVYLRDAGTEEACLEVARRYGPGGVMLPERHRAYGHHGGLWVVGDRSGHSRQTSARQTDYEIVLRFFGAWPDFRLLVLSEESNPPLEDRLVTINLLLRDPFTGRTVLRAADRCTEFFTEMENVLLKPGQRVKDKEAAQRIGLSHLGDALEYWGWTAFPRGRLDSLRARGWAAVGGERLSGGLKEAGASRLATQEPLGPELPGGGVYADAPAGSRRSLPDW